MCGGEKVLGEVINWAKKLESSIIEVAFILQICLLRTENQFPYVTAISERFKKCVGLLIFYQTVLLSLIIILYTCADVTYLF